MWIVLCYIILYHSSLLYIILYIILFACNAKSFADACFFLLLLLICVSISYWQMFSAYLPHPFPRKRVARIGLISLVTLANVIASVLFIVKFGLGQHYLCYREKRNENINLAGWWFDLRHSYRKNHMTLESRGIARSHNNLKTYLPYHHTYGHEA